MRSSRATGWWLTFLLGAGLSTAGFSTGPARAAPEPDTRVAAGFDLPEPPAVVVTVEGKPGSSETKVEPARPVPPTAASVAPLELRLPTPPEAPVTITVSDQMGDALASRLADVKFQLHPRLQRREREALAAFYAIGGFKPLWVEAGAWTRPARSLIERLKSAQEDGLDGADYTIPAIGVVSRDTPTDLAEAELKLSASAILYARDARGARIDLGRLSRLITPKLELPAGDAVLTQLASSPDAGAALAGYNPVHPGYRALKAKLAELRASKPAGSRLEGDLIANMERWRWLPSDLGRRHILVNIPEFRLRVMDEGRLIHEARVVVGKPDTPTPLFSDIMDHAIVNPSWNVPPSIFKNEFNSDPAYAASRGYEVVRTKDGLRIRQPPGERNALGFIKFMFPNQHAVYLHDTPSRSLFGAERRAFSHGCVRLDQPFRFGQIVLGAEWTELRLRSLIGRGERTIHLPQKLPVHLAYFTLFVDDRGELRHASDLYAVNNKVRVALGLPSDGTVVAAASRPKQPRVQAPRRTEAVQAPRRIEAAQAAVSTAQARRRAAVPDEDPMFRTPLPMADPSGSWWVAR